MPRSHGRIMASIWNDPDFLALEAGPQRLYLFLLSQPDLSHAGLVPMRVRRWAKKVALATPSTVTADLGDLEDARFVVTDEETEEVLIRTFVRNDGVYKQPKVMLRLREDARQIESALLRRAFWAELDRLPLHELAMPTRVTIQNIVNDLIHDFQDVSAGRYPSERVSDTPTDTLGVPIANPSQGLSDTPRVRAGAFPQPPAPSPQPPAPVPATPGASLALPAAQTSQSLVSEWIDHCADKPPSRVIGHIAKEVKTLLDDGIDYERVRTGLAEWNTRDVHPSVLPSIVHGIANRKPRTGTKRAEDEAMFERQMQRAIAREAGQA